MHSCEERCDLQSGSPADAFMQREVRLTEWEPGRCIHAKRGATYRVGARPMHSCKERCDLQSGSLADAFM